MHHHRNRLRLRSGLVGTSLALALLGGCAAPDDDIDILFSPCDPVLLHAVDASNEQSASVEAAAEMWNALGTSVQTAEADALDTAEPLDDIPVWFDDAAPQFFGLYRDEVGDIVVNRSVTDAGQRAIVIAHELGHAFGLEHVSDRVSVMNEGNVSVAPGEADARDLASAWPDCALSLELEAEVQPD